MEKIMRSFTKCAVINHKKPSSLRRGLQMSNFSSPYLSDPDESVGISTFA